LRGAHDNRLDDLSLLHRGTRNGAFHRSDDDVAHRRIRVAAAAGDVNAQELARARVVGYLETGFLLNHLLLRSLDDVEKTPPLLFRVRAAFLNAYDVADPGVVLLVVRLEARRAAYDLLIDGVTDAGLADHHDRFLHLVGHDAALLD